MIDIPLNAKVECTDGFAGYSTCMIVEPKTLQVTHVVVEEKKKPHTQRLVPIDQVLETSPDLIRLSRSLDELASTDPFVVTAYYQVEVPRYVGVETAYPYYFPDIETLPVDRELIPDGQIAVRPGSVVEATDGRVGHVDDLVVDSETGKITHLVLREGHVWGNKDVLLPISIVSLVTGDTVYLALDKATIATMLGLPARWRSRLKGAGLLVKAFSDVGGAQEAMQALRASAKQGGPRVLNAAVLVKDADGRAGISESEDVDPRHGAVFGAITGGLVGLLAGPAGAIVGAAAGAATARAAARRIDMGFPDEYLKKLGEALQPGTSALVTLVEQSSVPGVTDALAAFEGQLVQHALTDDLLERLSAEGQAG